MKPILLLSVAAITSLSFAAPTHFAVVSGGSQLAQFESATAVETFTGTTNKVSGNLTFDRAKLTGSGKLVVQVSGFDTKIPLRNQHLQSKDWLDATAYPTIIFEATKVSHTKGDTYTVEGKLTIHGVTKNIKTAVTAKFLKADQKTKAAGFKGDVLQIKTEFKVALADYNIKISPMAKGKVADSVVIRVTAYGTSTK